MNSKFTPKLGTRFSLYGASFEITFIAHGRIRYSSTAGGQPHKISLTDFIDLVECGKIESDCSFNPPSINIANAPHLIRRYRYVQTAITELKHPTAEKPLSLIIERISNELGECPPSVRSVARWIEKYRNGNSNSLAKQDNPGNCALRFSPEMELLINEAIHVVYLKPERFSSIDVYSYIVGQLVDRGLCNAHSSNVQPPTLRTIQRRIKALDPYVVAKAKKGNIVAEKIARASGRKIISYSVMSIVQIDTHTLDVIVIDEDTGDILGRPFLTLVIEIKTRVVVGVYISMYPASAVTSLAALKDMLSRPNRNKPGGIPAKIIPDNGVEFNNSAFAKTCDSLSITISPAQVRDGNGKAHIESFFNTIAHDIVHKLSGTTFSNIKAREGYDSVKNAVFTIKVLNELIEFWMDEIYHKDIHTKTGRAPILHWQDEIKIMPPLAFAESEIDAIARRPIQRTINNGRISLDYIEYFSHALRTLEAQNESHVTVLINDLDLSSVFVQHPTEKNTLILAESTDPDYTRGLTVYEHKEAKKIRKEMSNADLKKLGKYATLISRYKLMQKIQEETFSAKRWLKKLTNGEPRNIYAQRKLAEINNAINNPIKIENKVIEASTATNEIFSTKSKPSVLCNKTTYDSIELE